MKYQPRRKPYRHQAKASIRAAKQKNHAFFMDVGTGKTKAALDAIGLLALAKRVQRVAIICPKRVISVWEDEIQTDYPYQCWWETPEYRSYLMNRDRKSDAYSVKFQAWNYDLMSRREEVGNHYVYPYIKELQQFKPDLIVLDESHRCKRAGAIRSQALWRLVERIRKLNGGDHPRKPWVFLMTGTPNPKGYIDIFAQYRIMDENIFGTNIGQFKESFIRYGVGRAKYRVVGYNNKDILLGKIKAYATIVPKHKALDLPTETWSKIPVDLPARVREAYNEMAESFVTEIEGETIEAAHAATRRLRLKQITGGFTTSGVVLHRAKLAAAREWLEDQYEQNRYSIVYAGFTPEVDALLELAERVGFRAAKIDGSVSERDSTEARRAFQRPLSASDGKPMALVIQHQSGGIGLTLTRASEDLFYSLPDAWDHYYQCTGRIHRSGQTAPVTHYHLVARGTIDIHQVDSLREKADVHGELMRSPRKYLFGL